MQMIWRAGTTPILEKTLREWWRNEDLSCGFPSIPEIVPGVALRIVVLALLKSWDAIPRMEFRIPGMEFRIPRAALRIPRNSPRAPRMAFSLRPRGSVPNQPLTIIGLEAKGLLDFQGRRGIASVVRWNLRPVIFGADLISLVLI